MFEIPIRSGEICDEMEEDEQPETPQNFIRADVVPKPKQYLSASGGNTGPNMFISEDQNDIFQNSSDCILFNRRPRNSLLS